MIQVTLANPNVLNLLQKDMRKFGQKLSKNGGMRKVLEEIRDEVVIPSIHANFAAEGRPAWEDLAIETWERRGSAGNILQPSGQLRRAATAKARFQIKNNQMMYGNWPSHRWFGPIHDMAELSARARIPNRPFAVIQPEDITKMGNVLEKWVKDKAQESFRPVYR